MQGLSFVDLFPSPVQSYLGFLEQESSLSSRWLATWTEAGTLYPSGLSLGPLCPPQSECYWSKWASASDASSKKDRPKAQISHVK